MTAIRWTDEGIAFHSQPGAVGWLGDDPLDTPDLDAIVVRWPELRRLEATEPWPSVRVEWEHAGAVSDATFDAGSEQAAAAFDAQVEALFDHVARFRPYVLVRGWLEAPNVLWTLVDSLPGETDDRAGGPYRTAGATERVLARRSQSTAYERLISIALDVPWREVGGEVVVTTERVYVRRPDGSVRAVPFDSLRRVTRAPGGDLVAVFGRKSELFLRSREDCPVEAFLMGAAPP